MLQPGKWTRAVVLGWSLAALLCVAGSLQAQPDPAETRRLHDLFDAEWEWSMRKFPEWATPVGDTRSGDRLTARSLRTAADASRPAPASWCLISGAWAGPR